MLRDIECYFKSSEGISAGPGNFSVRETLCHTYVGLSIVLCKLFWKSYQLIYGSNRSPK